MTSRKPSRPPNGIRIDGGAYAQLERAARQAYPEEGCGVLLGAAESGTVREIRSLENRAGAALADRHYRADPLALYALERRVAEEGLGIIGFWHSHADAEAIPSAEDERFMVPGMVYLILPVRSGGTGRGRAFEKRTADGPVEEIGIRARERM